MPSFTRVKPDDLAAVATSTGIINAARLVDDPDRPPEIAELQSRELEFGWDLQPVERYLYAPDEQTPPMGVMELELPVHDNRHLVWAEITVHPAHRRQGHGTAILAEVLRRTRESGRSTVWLGTPADDIGAQAFIEKFGFGYASHDARRRQLLSLVDRGELDRLHEQARAAATDYVLERLPEEVPDDVLAQLVEVTGAINDAPMGDLTHEDETFDLQRLRDVETAAVGRGERLYRMVARQRDTGEIGGHTVIVFNPARPTYAGQGDTAVARHHRGHRLGLLLKIEMMRWLAEEQPQVEVVDTFNHADNRYMISVNEAIGYRLSRVFNVYELNLDGSAAG